jgi:hypothetical protein
LGNKEGGEKKRRMGGKKSLHMRSESDCRLTKGAITLSGVLFQRTVASNVSFVKRLQPPKKKFFSFFSLLHLSWLLDFFVSFPFLLISLPCFFWKHLFHLHLLFTPPKEELHFFTKKLFLTFSPILPGFLQPYIPTPLCCFF